MQIHFTLYYNIIVNKFDNYQITHNSFLRSAPDYGI